MGQVLKNRCWTVKMEVANGGQARGNKLCLIVVVEVKWVEY